MQSSKINKWPKKIPPLTPEQEWISIDYYHHWLTILPNKYRLLEKFNQGYTIQTAPSKFVHTLEIGGGLGEHLKYEKLSYEQTKNYVVLDLRESLIKKIQTSYPHITAICGDCQKPLPFEDGYFDRIIAIHVLEHLPNLPAAIHELFRVCNKKSGTLSIVIPCEGGLAYSFARKISSKRIFEKRYNQPYDWFIQREHLNKPKEIFEEIAPYFNLQSSKYFPFLLPFIFCNICIGAAFSPIVK